MAKRAGTSGGSRRAPRKPARRKPAAPAAAAPENRVAAEPAAPAPASKPLVPASTGPAQAARARWVDVGVKSSYANVCNVNGTLEEVVMLFGFSRDWDRGQGEMTILLANRIILSPYAAKRLMMVLYGVLKEYEKRFGALNVERPAAQQ